MHKYVVRWECDTEGSEGEDEFAAYSDQDAEEHGKKIALQHFDWDVLRVRKCEGERYLRSVSPNDYEKEKDAS